MWGIYLIMNVNNMESYKKEIYAQNKKLLTFFLNKILFMNEVVLSKLPAGQINMYQSWWYRLYF